MTHRLTTRIARARRPGAALAALVAALLGTALLGAARGAAAQTVTPERRVGLIVHKMDARHVKLLKNANVSHVKTTLYWNLWESDPAYRTEFAAGIERLAAAGLEITVVVHAPPAGSGFATRDTVYSRFAAFVGARATQFPAVRNWQLWNEQDAGYTDVFGYGVVSPDSQGKNYAAMLKLAFPSVKRGNPGARVVVGGLGAPKATLSAWLGGLYAGQGPFDVLAVHAYGAPVSLAARERGDTVRRVMRARADTRPLWLTEFGIDSAQMVQAWGITDPATWDSRQRTEWSDVATDNDAARRYDRLIGYVLFDARDYGYGIVRKDTTTTRPAFTWLRQRNR